MDAEECEQFVEHREIALDNASLRNKNGETNSKWFRSELGGESIVGSKWIQVNPKWFEDDSKEILSESKTIPGRVLTKLRNLKK